VQRLELDTLLVLKVSDIRPKFTSMALCKFIFTHVVARALITWSLI